MEGRTAIVAVILLVLVVALALLICRAGGIRQVVGSIFGGRISIKGGAAGEKSTVPMRIGSAHGLDDAMHKYSLSLPVIGIHDLGGARWGGAQNKATQGKVSKAPLKAWQEYATWDELTKDPGAHKQYFADRADVLNSLDLDWSAVLEKVRPLLQDDREHIGLINATRVSRGGDNLGRVQDLSDASMSALRTGDTYSPAGAWRLSLVASEASPVAKGTAEDGVTFASVPSELVQKIASRPAMFIFHTHPDDPRGSALPSSADVSNAISMGFAGIYAANVVISRYGVFVYTPGWQVYKDLHEAANPGLAMRYYRHDTVAAMESIRSWKDWTLTDYQKLFDRHKMLYVVYPTSTFTSHSYLVKFRSYQEAPSDEDILSLLRRDIDAHRADIEKSGSKPRPARGAKNEGPIA